jgi:hypothetical protein
MAIFHDLTERNTQFPDVTVTECHADVIQVPDNIVFPQP